MIDNSLPPMGKFYTEAKANEMVAEERAKWLSVIEDIKAEIEAEYILKHYDDGLADALDIIDRKVKECDR